MNNIISNKITCVIPTYNRPSYLSRALTSIFNQTLLPHEIIVAENGFNSQNLDIINSFKNRSIPIRHFSSGSKITAFENWMIGFSNVNTELIKIVWDDDWISNNCLDSLYFLMIQNSARTVLCGATGHIEDKIYHWYQTDPIVTNDIKKLFNQIIFRQIPNSPLSGLHHSDDVLSAMRFANYPSGAITPNLVVGPDFAINLWGLFNKKILVFDPQPLVHMYSDGNNMTAQNSLILPQIYNETLQALFIHFEINLNKIDKFKFRNAHKIGKSNLLNLLFN